MVSNDLWPWKASFSFASNTLLCARILLTPTDLLYFTYVYGKAAGTEKACVFIEVFFSVIAIRMTEKDCKGQ